MSTMQAHPAAALAEAYSALQADYAERVGSSSVVARPDMLGGVGLVITYASTATYGLESRASGDGRFMHRVNRELFDSAADIPARYRKARAIAMAVEGADAHALIEAHRAHAIALAAYRIEVAQP